MHKKAFEIEKKRQMLASVGNINSLKKMYSSSLPSIKDLNSSGFWDTRYSEKTALRDQNPMTKKRVNIVYNYIPKNSKNILDVGVGLGWVEELLSRNKKVNLYGNDISPEAVYSLNKKFDGNFSEQSVYTLKYKKNFFDVVLALELLEHIPPEKIFGVLGSFYKLIKKGGVLIVSVPMNEGLEEMKDNPNGHVRMYTEDLIKAEMGISGFKVIASETLYAFDKFFTLKSIIAKAFNTHKPNNIILKSIKV